MSGHVGGRFWQPTWRDMFRSMTSRAVSGRLRLLPPPLLTGLCTHPFVCLPVSRITQKVVGGWLVGWLEFNVPFQHKYGYIRDEISGRWIFMKFANTVNMKQRRVMLIKFRKWSAVYSGYQSVVRAAILRSRYSDTLYPRKNGPLGMFNIFKSSKLCAITS